jgi:hypothetical protein
MERKHVGTMRLKKRMEIGVVSPITIYIEIDVATP